MKLTDLINRITGESSLPKKQVREILISSFKILKEAIKDGEVDEVVFRSPVFNIRRKIIPKVLPFKETPKSSTAEKPVHSPSLSFFSDRYAFLVAARIKYIAKSAVASVSTPGVLVTTILFDFANFKSM